MEGNEALSARILARVPEVLAYMESHPKASKQEMAIALGMAHQTLTKMERAGLITLDPVAKLSGWQRNKAKFKI